MMNQEQKPLPDENDYLLLKQYRKKDFQFIYIGLTIALTLAYFAFNDTIFITMNNSTQHRCALSAFFVAAILLFKLVLGKATIIEEKFRSLDLLTEEEKKKAQKWLKNGKTNLPKIFLFWVLYGIPAAILFVCLANFVLYFFDKLNIPSMIFLNFLLLMMFVALFIWLRRDYIHIKKKREVDVYYGIIPELLLTLVFMIILPFIASPFIGEKDYSYSSRIIVNDTKSQPGKDEEERLLKIIQGRKIWDRAYVRPNWKVEIDKKNADVWNIHISSMFSAVYPKDAFLKHNTYVDLMIKDIRKTKRYAVTQQSKPRQTEYKATRLWFRIDRPPPVSVLCSIVLLFVFLMQKTSTGNFMQRIEDWLKRKETQMP